MREPVMTKVGIVANPVSGKDIRRLVAHGSVFDNQEKVRIVRRLLLGLAHTGVREVIYMPDYYNIVERAQRGAHAALELRSAPMCAGNTQDDSTRAAQLMAQEGVACIFVLGGDGTSRAVAKGCGSTPLLPLSTGTNNVFPFMIEATVAGLAGGLIATGRIDHAEGCFCSCCLEVLRDGQPCDLALVDVAVYTDTLVASRAIWDLRQISQIFLTRCRPDSIGLSALGGQLCTISPEERQGLHLELGSSGRRVAAAIAPGLLQTATISRATRMLPGDVLDIDSSPCVLAMDGEREIEVRRQERLALRFSQAGPLVVDVRQVMAHAQKKGLFVENI